MSEQLFNDQANNRIKSPDDLNEYIKVANPGMWVSLVAIIVFLLGGLFWCVFGRLDTRENTFVKVADGMAVCYLSADRQQYANDSMYITIDDKAYKMGDHLSEMAKLDENNDVDRMILHTMNRTQGGWFLVYYINNCNLADGVYEGEIILDSVSPMSFLTQGK